ncbi:hypothetical protein DL93DRAFT_2156943 [Clavulina sp. PMI_390]|nr:hypothetical protein DL93DRAFT_2156943 [Clavulina sp. PMI_390]
MDASGRPGIRRKSSASNLLSNLQTSRMTPQVGSQSNISTQKEWDSGANTPDNNTSAGSLAVPTSSTESVRETLNRRLLAIAHVRQSYEGKQHWLNTVLIDNFDLEKTFNNNSMRKRTWKFAVLGMSLASTLDMKGSDALRALTTIMNEYDQMPDQPPEEIVRSKRSLLRGRQSKRPGNTPSNDISEQEPTLALGINIPFPLDYFQVLITFCDILTEVYNKLRTLVSSAPLLNSGMQHSVPPGAGYSIIPQTPNHSNNPIYAQLFPVDHAPSRSIADTPSPQSASVPFLPGGMVSPASGSGPPAADMILKLDGRFKKIVNNLLKELDAMARESIKHELLSLDPLLRNMGLSMPNEGAAGLTFDFDV